MWLHTSSAAGGDKKRTGTSTPVLFFLGTQASVKGHRGFTRFARVAFLAKLRDALLWRLSWLQCKTYASDPAFPAALGGANLFGKTVPR